MKTLRVTNVKWLHIYSLKRLFTHRYVWWHWPEPLSMAGWQSGNTNLIVSCLLFSCYWISHSSKLSTQNDVIHIRTKQKHLCVRSGSISVDWGSSTLISTLVCFCIDLYNTPEYNVALNSNITRGWNDSISARVLENKLTQRRNTNTSIYITFYQNRIMTFRNNTCFGTLHSQTLLLHPYRLFDLNIFLAQELHLQIEQNKHNTNVNTTYTLEKWRPKLTSGLFRKKIF